MRGELSLPASPPPEVLRAIRSGSEVCVALISGNDIGDVSNARIMQRVVAMDGGMASRSTTLLFCEIPYRARNRYGIIICELLVYIYI